MRREFRSPEKCAKALAEGYRIQDTQPAKLHNASSYHEFGQDIARLLIFDALRSFSTTVITTSKAASSASSPSFRLNSILPFNFPPSQWSCSV
jgi:hypothetical protein